MEIMVATYGTAGAAPTLLIFSFFFPLNVTIDRSVLCINSYLIRWGLYKTVL